MGLRNSFKNIVDKIKNIFKPKQPALSEGTVDTTITSSSSSTPKQNMTVEERLAAYDTELSDLYSQEAVLLNEVLDAINTGDSIKANELEIQTSRLSIKLLTIQCQKSDLVFEANMAAERQRRFEEKQKEERLTDLRAKVKAGEPLSEEEQALLDEDNQKTKETLREFLDKRKLAQNPGQEQSNPAQPASKSKVTVEDIIAMEAEKDRERKKAKDPNFELREAIQLAKRERTIAERKRQVDLYLGRNNNQVQDKTSNLKPTEPEVSEMQKKEQPSPISTQNEIENDLTYTNFEVKPYSLDNGYLVNQNQVYTDMLTVFEMPVNQRRNFEIEELKSSIISRVIQMKGMSPLYEYSDADAFFINSSNIAQRKELASQISMHNYDLMQKKSQMCLTAMEANRHNEAMDSIHPITVVSAQELQERANYMKALKSKMAVYGIDSAKVDASFSDLQQKLAIDGHSLDVPGSTPLFLFMANEIENSLINLRTNEIYSNRNNGEEQLSQPDFSLSGNDNFKKGLKKFVYSFLKKNQIRTSDVTEVRNAEKSFTKSQRDQDGQEK